MRLSANIVIILLISSIALACEQKLPSFQDFYGNTTGNQNNQGNKPSTPEPEQPNPDTPVTDLFYIDQELIVGFNSAPVLGTEGEIKIFKEDGTEIDAIKMADVAAPAQQMTAATLYNTTHDCLGVASQNRWRIVNYRPVTVSGNNLVVRPHYGKLEYGKTYYMTIDAQAVSAEGFKGIAAGEWKFTTKNAPTSTSEVTVAKSVEADFRTIQAAINYAYECGPSKAMTINIKNGVYEEQLFARLNNKITFKGESREGVVLQYRNAEALANGTGGSAGARPEPGNAIGKSGGRAVILFEDCDDIRFENMTMKNTYGIPGQAEVIYNNDNGGKYNIAFINCSLHSLQDTFCSKGYCWMYNCLVEGDCDFVWGYPKTCLFENCEIRAAGDGYIVQSRCQEAGSKGFVFLNCNITKTSSTADGTMYLARSGGAKEYYDNVAYINCRMSGVIPAGGWYSNPMPNPAKATAASGWKEYGSMDMNGAALNVSNRNSASYQLTKAEYEAEYKDRSVIFKGASVGTDWLTY